VERRGDEVWFELLAVAGPRHWLKWLRYPLLRRLQRTFARAAAAAVTRAAVSGGGAPDGRTAVRRSTVRRTTVRHAVRHPG
jgi:hypothetical protein